MTLSIEPPVINRAESVPRSKLPRLSIAERDRRWKAIRDEMERQGLALLLVHGDSGKWDQKFTNMRYLSQIGGDGEDGWLVFPLEGEPSAHVFSGGAMHQMWGEMQDWMSDVRPAPGLRWSSALIGRIKDLGLERARIGVVGLEGYQETEGTVSYLTLSRLKEQFPEAQFVDATHIVEDFRMVKSAEEIGFIEQAARIGDAAIRYMRRHAQPGAAEHDVYAGAFATMLSEGAEQPLCFFWDAGSNVSHGQRYPGRSILQQGDVIVTELTPRYLGHWVQFSAPVAVGEPTPEYQRLFDVAYTSNQNALKTLRPGITLGDLAEAFERPIVDAGLTSLHVHVHGTGQRGSDHPVIFPPSRRVGMPPEVLAKVNRILEIEVKEGMVFAFEPHVTYGPGKPGLHLGDPVVVTSTGCRSLSQLDLRDWSSAGA
jgi:Xaa-Pro aminopeptidase